MLIVVAVVCVRRLDTLSREAAATLRAVRENLVPLADEVQRTIAETDGLIGAARPAVERIDRICESVERFVEGKTVVDAAGSAVRKSRTTVVSWLEGIKQGLKTLRRARDEAKEESEDESS